MCMGKERGKGETGYVSKAWKLEQACDSQALLCRRRSYHIDAMLVGAFPGTPVHATDLTSGNNSSDRTWVCIDLLDHLLLTRKNNPRIAMDSTTKTIFEMHKRNNGTTLIQEDTVRKLLGKTLDEYELVRLKQCLEVLAVAEEPQAAGGCLQACPACAAMAGRSPSSRNQGAKGELQILFQVFGGVQRLGG
jgi:hypothetical protein